MKKVKLVKKPDFYNIAKPNTIIKSEKKLIKKTKKDEWDLIL